MYCKLFHCDAAVVKFLCQLECKTFTFVYDLLTQSRSYAYQNYLCILNYLQTTFVMDDVGS